MGTRLYIQALLIDHLLSFTGFVDVDDLVVAIRRQEPYIIAMETDPTLRYHICIESQCLFSVNTLGDALADVICAYFVFNIAHPKPMYLFLQHFVLGLQVSQKVPTSVSTL